MVWTNFWYLILKGPYKHSRKCFLSADLLAFSLQLCWNTKPSIYIFRKFCCFQMFIIFYRTLVMTQLFLKEPEHHKITFIWKQLLKGVPLNMCPLKSSIKKFIFRLKNFPSFSSQMMVLRIVSWKRLLLNSQNIYKGDY